MNHAIREKERERERERDKEREREEEEEEEEEEEGQVAFVKSCSFFSWFQDELWKSLLQL